MLTIIFPKDTSLQRYVDFFYFFRPGKSERWNHIAFPHVNTGLSFFRNVLIERNDNRISIREMGGSKPCIEILGKYTNPVFVSCEGLIDEVAIVFKPLGVNRFIREDFIKAAPDCSQPYSNGRWLKAAEDLFYSDNRIEFLEKFLISVLSENKQFIKMEQSLYMLDTNEFDYSVADVAKNLNINLKTFQRNFKKMMACSPSDYKRIARFRNALRSKFQSGEIKSLTNITYEQNYTDQSYFIREFRKLTNQNPKLFFKDVSLIDGDKIIWEIL
jgi:AraC-like DNA-binding protein